MTPRLPVLSVLLCGLAAAAPALPPYPVPTHPPKAYALRGGLWWEEGAFRPLEVYVVDERLTRVRPPRVDSVVDLAGRWIIPPLADAHNHYLSDGMDYDAQLREALRRGIFYVKNPNNAERRTRGARARVNTPRSVDVAYSNGGITSTGGHPEQLYAALAASGRGGWTREDLDGQAFFAVDDADELERRWDEVLRGRPDFLKVYLERSEEHARRRDDPESYGKRGLDPALLPRLVAKAHAAGLRVSAHVTSRADFRAAVGAGVDEVTHLPLERLAREDAAAAAARGTWVVTTTTSHRPGPERAALDSIHRANLALLHAAGVRLALGTDNHTSVLEEAENVCRLGVLPNAELLSIWTEQTPRTIFPDRRIGSLAEGSEASFLALDGDPLEDFRNVRRVSLRMKQGHLLAGLPDPDPAPPEAPSRCSPPRP